MYMQDFILGGGGDFVRCYMYMYGILAFLGVLGHAPLRGILEHVLDECNSCRGWVGEGGNLSMPPQSL